MVLHFNSIGRIFISHEVSSICGCGLYWLCAQYLVSKTFKCCLTTVFIRIARFYGITYDTLAWSYFRRKLGKMFNTWRLGSKRESHVTTSENWRRYLKPMKIIGIFQITKEYFYDLTKIWKHDLFPHRVGFQPKPSKIPLKSR